MSVSREEMYWARAPTNHTLLAPIYYLLSILEVGGGPTFSNYLHHNQTILCSFLFLRFCMHKDFSRGGLPVHKIIKAQGRRHFHADIIRFGFRGKLKYSFTLYICYTFIGLLFPSSQYRRRGL